MVSDDGFTNAELVPIPAEELDDPEAIQRRLLAARLDEVVEDQGP